MTDLSQFDDAYAGADAPPEHEFDPLPPGQYQAEIEDVQVGESKSKGTPYIQFWLRIVAPAQVGRMAFKTCWLSEKALPYAKVDLSRAGFIVGETIGKLSDLEDASVRQQAVGTLMQINVKHGKNDKGEIKEDVFFLKRISGGLDTPPAPPDVPDDKIPF